MSVVGTSTAKTTAGDQYFSVPLPSGVQNGDVLVAGYNVATDTLNITAPAGWTVFQNNVQMNGLSMKISVVWRVMANGVTAPTWSLSGPSSAKATGFVVALRGRTSTPVFGTPYTRSASQTTTPAPGVTPSAANSDLLGIYFDKVSSQTGVAPPSGMTEILQEIVSGGGAVSAMVAHELRSTTAATGTKTATYDVASSLAYGVLMYAPPTGNVPPTVSAGSDQNTVAGVQVTLSGSASDSDGTIASRLWTQTGGPTVTLSGATTNTATFTPSAAGVYIFEFSATDNGGASNDDSVTITVSGSTARPISIASNPGGWGVVGPQATTWEALADDDETSYIETPAGPVNAAITTKLAPVSPGNVIIRTRDRQDVASPVITRTVELLQGTSTVIASFTPFTLTTDWVEHSFSLTSGQNAAITDRSNLHVRISDLTA